MGQTCCFLCCKQREIYNVLDNTYEVDESRILVELWDNIKTKKVDISHIINIVANSAKYCVNYNIVIPMKYSKEVTQLAEFIYNMLKEHLDTKNLFIIDEKDVPKYDISNETTRAMFIYICAPSYVIKNDITLNTDIFIFPASKTQQTKNIPSDVIYFAGNQYLEVYYRDRNQD